MGNAFNKPFYKRGWFILIAIIIVVAAVGKESKKVKSIATVDTESTSISNSEAESNKDEQSAVEKEDTKITYDNFLSIKMGMTYDEVKQILGEGSEMSSNEISGIKTTMYTWQGSGMSNISVTIQNDAVTNKAQAGLKDMDAGITMDKYNQVKNGMTYDEVKGILGEGQILSETKIMDTTSVMYEYINKDGSNANFTFDSSGVVMKAQFNLK